MYTGNKTKPLPEERINPCFPASFCMVKLGNTGKTIYFHFKKEVRKQ